MKVLEVCPEHAWYSSVHDTFSTPIHAATGVSTLTARGDGSMRELLIIERRASKVTRTHMKAKVVARKEPRMTLILVLTMSPGGRMGSNSSKTNGQYQQYPYGGQPFVGNC